MSESALREKIEWLLGAFATSLATNMSRTQAELAHDTATRVLALLDQGSEPREPDGWATRSEVEKHYRLAPGRNFTVFNHKVEGIDVLPVYIGEPEGERRQPRTSEGGRKPDAWFREWLDGSGEWIVMSPTLDQPLRYPNNPGDKRFRYTPLFRAVAEGSPPPASPRPLDEKNTEGGDT